MKRELPDPLLKSDSKWQGRKRLTTLLTSKNAASNNIQFIAIDALKNYDHQCSPAEFKTIKIQFVFSISIKYLTCFNRYRCKVLLIS